MKKMMFRWMLCVFALTVVCGSASAATIYNSLPIPYPHNIPSLGYEATSTREFGNAIQFAGTERDLTSVTVAMSDWAWFTGNATNTGWGGVYPNGYSMDFTLNLYNVNPAPGAVTPGSLIASLATTATVPLRPDGWDMNGILFNIVFDATSFAITLPDEIVFGLSYNTQHYGNNPTGVSGPYNSLNFGLNTSGPSVGTDLDADSVFWNTSHGPFYSDGGAAGVSLFRADSGWTGYTPAIMFTAADAPVATPEPGTMLLMGLGAIGAGFMRRRDRKAA